MAKGSKSGVAALKLAEQQRRASRDDILTPQIIEDDIYLVSLDATVRIKSMSHNMRKALQDKYKFGTEEWDEEGFNMEGIVKSMMDPELTLDDVEALKEQSATVIDELINAISHLNMFGRALQLKKGSLQTPSSDSDSNSQKG